MLRFIGVRRPRMAAVSIAVRISLAEVGRSAVREKIQNKVGGLLFVFVGLSVCIYSYFTLRIGTALQMGPGYLPFVLGILLTALGAAIASRKGNGGGASTEKVAWRALIFICLAPITFVVFIESLGLILATAISCLVACWASPDISPGKRFLLTVGLSVFCLFVFSYGLNISVPLFGTRFSPEMIGL